MQDEEPRDQKRAFDEVETDGGGVERGQQTGEGCRSQGNSDRKGPAMAVMEEVARFEPGGEPGMRRVQPTGIEQAGIQQAVERVEYPDGEGHGCGRGKRKTDVAAARDEPGPQRGDGGRVEREQVPARQRAGGAGRKGELCGGGHR